MLCRCLAVQPRSLVDFTELLFGLADLALKVLHQLLVTNIFTLSQFTLCLSYFLFTTHIPT